MTEENSRTGLPQPAWATVDGYVSLKRASAVSAHDRALVSEVLSRFMWAYDEHDRDVMSDCFTHDASFNASLAGTEDIEPVSGRDTIVDWLASYWDEETEQKRHLVTNVLVDDLTPDSATVVAMLLSASAHDGRLKPVTTGVYRTTVRRDDDGVWRLEHFFAGYDVSY